MNVAHCPLRAPVHAGAVLATAVAAGGRAGGRRARRSFATPRPSSCSANVAAADRGCGARPEQRQGRPAQRSRDQRLRCARPDRLSSVGADRRRRQRQPGPGRGRARARPRRRRGRDPQRRGRQASDRHQHPVAGPGSAGDGRRRGRGGNGHHDGGPAGGARRILAFTRAQEATADATGSRYSPKPGISGKGMLDFFGKLQNQEYRLAIYSTDSFDRDSPAFVRAHPGARAEAARRIRPGASRPIRRSKRASSG